MQKKLQVFISSTYEDMKAERQAAVEAVLQAGHIPAGMELFSAGDESQLETIRRWIDESDVFLLIFGGRYGSIEPISKKSYIHLEYEHAVERGKPHFALVMKSEQIEAKVKESGTRVIELDNRGLWEEFRKTVTSKMCRFFANATELKLFVMERMSELSRRSDLAGWVKDVSPSRSELMANLISLQERHDKAISELAEFQKAGSTPSIDDLIELLDTECPLRTNSGMEVTQGVSYYDIFMLIGDLAFDCADFADIRDAISKNHFHNGASVARDYEIDDATFRRIQLELVAREVVHVEAFATTWSLTRLGVRLLHYVHRFDEDLE